MTRLLLLVAFAGIVLLLGWLRDALLRRLE